MWDASCTGAEEIDVQRRAFTPLLPQALCVSATAGPRLNLYGCPQGV